MPRWGQTAPTLARGGAQINAVLPRLEQLLAGLRYASAHLAHEIRTPLQAIHGDVARLAWAGDAGERRRIEASIENTIDHADARLQSVMGLFGIQAGEKVKMRDGVDLGDLLERGGRVLAPTIRLRVPIRCNPPLMETLVINPPSNVAKYSPPGARIDVGLTREEGRFRPAVGNSGSEFGLKLRGSAFTRFTRADPRGAIPGFGLGFATVAGIAALHGFEVEFAPPRGAGGRCLSRGGRHRPDRNRSHRQRRSGVVAAPGRCPPVAREIAPGSGDALIFDRAALAWRGVTRHCDTVFLDVANGGRAAIDFSIFYLDAAGAVFFLDGYAGSECGGLRVPAGETRGLAYVENLSGGGAAGPVTLLLLAVPADPTAAAPRDFRYLERPPVPEAPRDRERGWRRCLRRRASRRAIAAGLDGAGAAIAPLMTVRTAEAG